MQQPEIPQMPPAINWKDMKKRFWNASGQLDWLKELKDWPLDLLKACLSKGLALPQMAIYNSQAIWLFS